MTTTKIDLSEVEAYIGLMTYCEEEMNVEVPTMLFIRSYYPTIQKEDCNDKSQLKRLLRL